MKVTNAFHKWQKFLLKLFCCYLLGMATVVQADIAIIVNPVNSGVSMNLSSIQDIFLGIKLKLPNGATVSPLDQSSEQAIRQKFYQLVAGKSAVEMKAYWARIIFTGRGSPPPVLPDGSAIRHRVASDKGAIGYVDASLVQDASDVSIIFTIPTQ